MKLLSWNIQWGRGMDGIVDLNRILDTIRILDTFDVICLQEVAVNFPGLAGSRGEDQFALLSQGLPEYTGIYGIATDMPNAKGGRSYFGNAIFSRLPVAQVWRHLLPWPAEETIPSMQRILIEAVIQSGFGAIRVLTTHLEYYSQHQRKQQIANIRHLHYEACTMSRRTQYIEEQGGPFEVLDRPAEAILCGDMNFPATAEERLQLLSPFDSDIPDFLDTRTILYPDEPHIPTVGIHPVDFVNKPECFDHIFITSGLINHLKTHRVDTITAASDHQPVWTELI
ncbi:MAG: endonuclease/exonuclease/phosphatase family protein [Nitrosomonas sp.]|nr:endonuclease/exonuclease/phosphatase family protein [Nitrosomonas sp.]